MNQEYDITESTDDYYTLNSRVFPYTLRESLIVVDPDEKVKLRVLNGHSEGMALHIHGHKATETHYDGVEQNPVARVTRDDKTYLVHCDIAQHMEKGMKGQLVVGKGSTTFSSIPGISNPVIADNYDGEKPEEAVKVLPEAAAVSGQESLDFSTVLSGTAVGLVLTSLLIWFCRKYVTIENTKKCVTKLLELSAREGKRMLRGITSIIKMAFADRTKAS